MTTTTAQINDDDEDGDFVDEFAEAEKDLKAFLRAHGGASFKVVWERYLSAMLTTLREEIAEAHSRIDDVEQSIPEEDLLKEIEVVLGHSAIFFDVLLSDCGYLTTVEGNKTITDKMPAERRKQYEELAVLYANMTARIKDERARREAFDDIEGDEGDEGDGEAETPTPTSAEG